MPEQSTQWTFLTNHSHVLLAIWHQQDIRVRDIAQIVGITERAVMRIIRELNDAGFLRITKSGRENRYSVVGELPLRHPLEKNHTVRELLETLSGHESHATA
jgi:DNA-binding MarR family transcriptional regulator